MNPELPRQALRSVLLAVLALATVVATCGAQSPDAPSADSLATHRSDSLAVEGSDSIAVPSSDSIPVPNSTSIAIPSSDSVAAPSTDSVAVSTSDTLAVPSGAVLAAPSRDSLATPSSAPLAVPSSEPLAVPSNDSFVTQSNDPLAVEIARWTRFLETDTASDEQSVQVRAAAAPALDQARASLEHGRRLHALLRLAAAKRLLGALEYTREHADAAISTDTFEIEWRRAGPEILSGWPESAKRSLAAMRPAAIRAMAEAAIPGVEASYDASLEYGRATMTSAGLYYLGEAPAQQHFVAVCRSLTEPTASPEPPFRSLAPELAALQKDLLALYRPPLSIDRHPEFIAANSALKEARELNDAGLLRGAMLRYLQAAVRLEGLRAEPPAFDPVTTPARLAALAELMQIVGYEDRGTGLSQAGVDHSIGQLFLELARSDMEDTSATGTHGVAAAVAQIVLPRYLAAIQPVKAAPAAPTAQVTVTLVRWPYSCNLSDPASLLAQSVVQEFGGRARFVSENYGESQLANRNGVTRYPAIFVNDVLVATPKDFGFYGKGEGEEGGRYAPLRNAASHERLRADLARMISLILEGKPSAARAEAKPSKAAEISEMPAFTLTDFTGQTLSRDSLAGRPVVVEFWATWCPPCRSTLRWLGDLQKRYGDRVAVIAIAVESDEWDVRRIADELGMPFQFALGQPHVVQAFGDLGAVPTLFLFDADGRTSEVYYGATPTLHTDVDSKLAKLLKTLAKS